MFSQINKSTKIRKVLIFLLSLSLLILNTIAEIINNFQINSFLPLRILLVILIIFFFEKTKNKTNKIVKFLLIFWLALFLINIILNMINVYSIDCQLNEQICSIISSLFYKFKIFRFITLSSYFFTIPILLLLFLKYDCSSKVKINKLDFLQFFFFLILSFLFFSNLFKSFQAIYSSIIQSYQVIDENYYDRFTFKKGGVSYYGWIRVFSNFIIANTTEDINMLVPPRSDTYKMEGNINYFRWFMYPRRLYHLDDLANNKNLKIDYIVLSAGECDNDECVWPNYKIKQNKIDKIIIINRETQTTKEIFDTNYNPEDFYQKWGIIKLK